MRRRAEQVWRQLLFSVHECHREQFSFLVAAVVVETVFKFCPPCCPLFGGIVAHTVSLSDSVQVQRQVEEKHGKRRNKKTCLYCADSFGAVLYLRVLQGHSERNVIDPSLQEYVIVVDGFSWYIEICLCKSAQLFVTERGDPL